MRYTTRSGILVALLVALGLAPGTGAPALAQAVDGAAVANSVIQLTERATAGRYQRYTIVISSQDGAASIVADRDGKHVERAVPQDEYVALWNQVLQSGLRNLESTEGKGAPDQSRFVVSYQLGAETGSFSVYGVDSLSDTRYRDVVRAILAVGDRYMRAR